MKQGKILSRFAFGILFVFAGVNHFRSMDFYVAMMPPYLPWHRELVMLSGIAEMGLGALLLISRWSALAAWGIIALLMAIFPANIQMALHPEAFPWASPIVLWLRLPLQVVLMGWAYWYTRPDNPGH